ncbi:MLO-like protein 1 [Populus alba]|uniref:MLO-like protein n=2 Tax=Populus alba TaxID=43335 RepID=A0A4U5QYV7_POPAL|nr:MLO-like protein 1 [Populus alba]TKS16512.1 MLO-like protein 1 [Populus alba]
MAEGGTTLEYTPTWVVAAVCSVIVLISLLVERFLHLLGKLLKRKHQKPLFEALQKIKEELMLLGFISLLLTVFQSRINTICISEDLSKKMLPCKKETKGTTAHFQAFFSFFPGGTSRRLLAEASPANSCPEGKVPVLSTTALHHLHIFIFVLACVHVVFCALTILFGSAKIRQWKRWEDSISNKEQDPEQAQDPKLTNVQDHDFIRTHYLGFGKNSYFLGWLQSFFKQFYASVTRSDYITLRLGFIMTHCRGNLKFNFHKYMMRALEADFKKVVGISWYLWLFVVLFLLLNVAGWHAYFWIAFIPFILLLAVGTKLEHVISQLAHEVAEKHVAVQGDLVVHPSDDHFWFNKPKIVLILIHIILFQNSFEMAFFFWIWLQYGFDSCIMGQVSYIIPRLVIGAFIQLLCSYSTLPLYAIVTQMGSSFKKAIFDEHVQEGLVGWAKQAKKKTVLRKAANESTHNQVVHREESPLIQMAKAGSKKTAMEENK